MKSLKYCWELLADCFMAALWLTANALALLLGFAVLLGAVYIIIRAVRAACL